MASSARHMHGTVRQRLDLALGRELHTGERVQWQGMKLARIEPKGFALYLFAFPWTAFALFWTTLAATGVSEMEGGILSWAFPLFGLPFIVIGLAMLAAPFVPLLQRGRILFAVTDQRIMRLSLGRSLSVKSVPAKRVGQIERDESPDGTGSLKIAVRVGTDSDGDARTEHFDLGRVENVMSAQRAVEALT